MSTIHSRSWSEDLWFQCASCDWGECTGRDGCKGNELCDRIVDLEGELRVAGGQLATWIDWRTSLQKEAEKCLDRVSELGADNKRLAMRMDTLDQYIAKTDMHIATLEALLREAQPELRSLGHEDLSDRIRMALGVERPHE